MREINPELRYYCPKAMTWFKTVDEFCLSPPICSHYQDIHESYGKPLTLKTILCDFRSSGETTK